MTHNQLQAMCVQWFWNEYPELRGFLWQTKNNSVNRIQGSIDRAKGTVPGVADLIGFINGKFMAFEIKVGKDYQKSDQKQWQHKIESHGGHYYIIRSLEEFQQKIKPVV